MTELSSRTSVTDNLGFHDDIPNYYDIKWLEPKEDDPDKDKEPTALDVYIRELSSRGVDPEHPEYYTSPQEYARFLSRDEISAEFVRQFLLYDEPTGELYWRYRVLGGKPSLTDPYPFGGVNSHVRGKYRLANFGGIRVYVAHVVWIYHTGEWPNGYKILYRDKNPLNTRIQNLYRKDRPDLRIAPLPTISLRGNYSNDPSIRRLDRDFGASEENKDHDQTQAE